MSLTYVPAEPTLIIKSWRLIFLPYKALDIIILSFSNLDKYSSRLLVIAEAKSNKLTSIILNRSDIEIIYIFKLTIFSDISKNSVISNKGL